MNMQNLNANTVRNRVALFAVGVALAVGFGTAGRGDYEQAMADQAMYCHMGDAGFWPKGAKRHCPVQMTEEPGQIASR